MASKSKKTGKNGKAGETGPNRKPRGGGARSAPAGKKQAPKQAKRGDKPKKRLPSKAPFGARSSGRVKSLAAADRGGGPAPSARRMRETADSLEAAKAAIDAALDKKALLPVLIDVSGMASYTDFIGVVSGRSDRQVDAIAEGILTAMKGRGRSLLGQEGTGSGRWTLLDFGDVVIHVFYHPVREFYDLESLWVDAPRVPLRIPPEAVLAQPDALYGHL